MFAGIRDGPISDVVWGVACATETIRGFYYLLSGVSFRMGMQGGGMVRQSVN